MEGNLPQAKRLRVQPNLGEPEGPAVNQIIPAQTLNENDVDKSLRSTALPTSKCPYMHTINLKALDFDFEKLCSVSLESHHIYACLVCGRYFQGRGPSSHAFAHALDSNHHIFLNLETLATYTLPDNERLEDPLIDRITRALRPSFTPEAVNALDATPHVYRTLNGERHTQGVTILDNLHASSYANVIFQILAVVTPIRNYLLLAPHGLADVTRLSVSPSTRVLRELASLVQKIWSPAAFRDHISPHEIMQEVSKASNGRFSYQNQSDPVEFFAWLLHVLQREVSKCYKGEKAEGKLAPWRRNKLLVQECFQGSLEVTKVRDCSTKDAPSPQSGEDGGTEDKTSKISHFWFLALDLPPKPLFKDSSERTLVTQVSLTELLKKYDGRSQHHVVETGEMLSFRLVKLPQYLILTLKRVSETKFVKEKNPAVVHCPITGLDMAESCNSENAANCMYNLVAIVIREGPPEKSIHRIAFSHAASGKWYAVDNMEATEVLPQLVSLSESSLLLYKRDL